MAYVVRRWWGKEERNLDPAKFSQVLAELKELGTEEHSSVCLKHETEWALSYGLDGRLVLENVETGASGARHLEGLSVERVAELWQLLASGDLPELNKLDWAEGDRAGRGDVGEVDRAWRVEVNWPVEPGGAPGLEDDLRAWIGLWWRADRTWTRATSERPELLVMRLGDDFVAPPLATISGDRTSARVAFFFRDGSRRYKDWIVECFSPQLRQDYPELGRPWSQWKAAPF